MAARVYEQIIEGEWNRVPKRGWRNACCSCEMVHIIDTRTPPDGSVEVRMRVDRRATAALRRKFKFTPDDE